MKICGIIAEYNPFHLGHMRQIEEVRRLLGEDTAIAACMSGDYVQRGEAAIADKILRAEAAVRCGADLVLSLPLRWSLSSAQGFADGGVHVLLHAGITHLAFGAEDADLPALQEIAALIDEKSVVDGTIRTMQTGLSFAMARERELYKRIREKSALIASPNNLLAVEYLRALRQQGADAEPIAVQRTGASHDGGAADGTASASHIRGLLREKRREEARAFLPGPSYEMLLDAAEQGFLTDDLSRLDCAMTFALKRMSAEDLARLPDAAEGLEYRLKEAIDKGKSFIEICDLAKTKRYAHSRLRRMLYRAFLGVERGGAPLPGWCRVLAFNDRGRAVLSQLEEQEDFVFLPKPAAAKHLPEDARADFALEARAADLYDLALPGYQNRPLGREWTKGPVYVR